MSTTSGLGANKIKEVHLPENPPVTANSLGRNAEVNSLGNVENKKNESESAELLINKSSLLLDGIFLFYF